MKNKKRGLSDGLIKKTAMTQQVLTILGSTGSIGVNTLDVISRHPEKFRVFALAGHRQVEKLAAQCARFAPEYAVVADAEHAVRLEALLKAQNSGTRVLHGAQALIDVASADEVDGVMCAIVGAAGLPSALAAAQKGKTIYSGQQRNAGRIRRAVYGNRPNQRCQSPARRQ